MASTDAAPPEVFIVMYWHCGSCGQILGVFADEEAANRARDERLAEPLACWDDVTVERKEVCDA